jgi:hypothetical protein
MNQAIASKRRASGKRFDGRPRARRLTLAPAPRAVVVPEAAEECCVFDASRAEDGRMVKLSPDSFAGQRRRFCGSKFWPPADELSSDEEADEHRSDEESDELCSEEEENDHWSPGVPMALGVASGVVHPAEGMCAVEEQQGRAFNLTAKVSPSYCFAGPEGRSVDRKTATAAAWRLAPKPWLGPLPAARRSPRLTLGDVLAKATKASLRKGIPKESASAPAPLVQDPVAMAISCSPPAGGEAASRSNFESRQHLWDLGAAGRAVGSAAGPELVGPPCSIAISNNGKWAHFTFSAGLNTLFSRAGRLRSRVLAASQRLSHRPFVSPPDDSIPSSPPLHSSGAPSEGGEGVDRNRRMERGGAGGWHGAAAGRGFGSGSRSGYPGEEEECFGGGEYQWASQGFDLGYGGAGPGGRARGWPRRGFQPRGGRGGGAMRGGLAGCPGRGGTSRGARAFRPRGGAPSRPAPPQQPTHSEESRKASGEANFPTVAAQVCGDVAQQLGPEALAGDGQGPEPVQNQGEREVSRVGGKAKICTRCSQKGHVSADCSSELYCDICDAHGDHANHRCPILKLPRPAAHAVGYSVEGLGFYHIPHPPLSRKKDSKTAHIKVVGGTLSLDQIVVQLQRIVLGKWKWEPVLQQDGSFVVVFPSKVELQRSIAYGGTDVRENGVSTGLRLEFEEWHGKEEGFLLPKVWIRVYGIRKKLREFLNLWAIGSMVGSTQTVDMKTTRKNNFGRILVAVLDPNLVPAKLDVVIGDHYFELRFEKE